MDIKKSAIKDLLDERRYERVMDKVGMIVTSILILGALGLFLNAFLVSKQMQENENCILPRNDAQMLNGYNQ